MVNFAGVDSWGSCQERVNLPLRNSKACDSSYKSTHRHRPVENQYLSYETSNRRGEQVLITFDLPRM